MTILTELLFTLSSALLIPVILLLLFLVLRCWLDIGGIIREWQDRRKGRQRWIQWCQKVSNGERDAAKRFYETTHYAGLVGEFARRVTSPDQGNLVHDKHANDLEITATGRLSGMSFGIRVGPMLGLMGTLIPLGPGLIELSKGNFEGMSGHLVVAFSTTILGLAVGGICYALWLVRRQWYAQDLSDIEFICQVLSAAEQSTDHHDEQ